jgi:transcriptional regulator with GAF, ATPase, and Fis domain
MQLSYIEVTSGICRGARAEPSGPSIDIGRDPDNDLVLSDSIVLPKHARLLVSVDGVSLEHKSCVGRTVVVRDADRLALDDQNPRIELRPFDRIELGLEGFEEAVTLGVHFCTPTADAQIFTARPMGAMTEFASKARVESILRTLATADGAILSSTTFTEVLTHIADAALGLVTRATHVTIVLREGFANPGDKSQDFVFALCRSRGTDGHPRGDAQAPRLVRSVFRRVVEDRAAVLAANAPSGSLATDSLLGASIQSTIAVPLWRCDAIIGVLQLDNRDAPAMFDRTDLDALAVLAGSASLALSNASLEQRLTSLEQGLRDENRYLRQKEQPGRAEVCIVGKSVAIVHVLEQVDKVAKTRATVLIEGETGVGKELVAAIIHTRSTRVERLFVAQNCAALPDNLLESELFGHKRGAFTGATDEKKGLFEVADGGTLFLDEVTEMSLSLQAKLLRVLQEGEVRPVGATRPRQVNVRIVAACNKCLQKEVADGRFRQDLYFRLNVFPIRVPPLRERKGDVPLLVEHFYARYTREYRKNLLGFAEGVMDQLEAYDWPGNVRELENEIQRLVIQADDSSFVTLQHLGERVRGARPSIQEPTIPKGTLKSMMSHVERRLVIAALNEYANNKTNTARSLGMTREGFHKKLRQLGIK